MQYKLAVVATLYVVSVAIVPLANAAPISYTSITDITFVTGSLIPLISTADKAYITVTLDPDTPVVARTASLSRYNAIQLDFSSGGFSESYKPSNGYGAVADILIRNDARQEGYIYDSYGLEGVKGASFFSFWLMDFSHSVYSNSTLPTGVPDLSAFQLRSAGPIMFGDFDLQFAFRSSCCITGEARGTALSVSSPVPEPGTLALLGLGLAGFGLNRRKHV